MTAPRVVVQLAVQNASSWLPAVLDALIAQTVPATRIVVWDNASTDATPDIVRRYSDITLIRSPENIGFWAAQERMFASGTEEYIIALTDVVLDSGFIAAAIAPMQHDATIGAIQGKLYQMSWNDGVPVPTTRIDALGFRFHPSRRVTILGHGICDEGQYTEPRELIAVEGAVPVFRRRAIEDCRVEGKFIDADYREGAISYGDDFDMGWRMALLGWRQMLAPHAIGWHDRSTTKGVARIPLFGQLARRTARAALPIEKRRLDWCNVRFTIIKNDYTINILRHLPAIVVREVAVQGYALLFEPGVLLGWGRFFRLLPTMLRRRRILHNRAVRTATEMRHLIA